MNIDVPMQKYATFRLVFHCIYAWQRLTAPISGIHTLIAYAQISSICNIPKTTMDRLTAIDIIVTILCIKGTSFHFDFIEKTPFLPILIYRCVHFIIFSCSHQCPVDLPALEGISPKGKGPTVSSVDGIFLAYYNKRIELLFFSSEEAFS